MDILTEPKRIDLPLIELSCRHNPVLKENYLILHDRYFEYRNLSEYDTDENEEGIMKRYISNWRKTIFRSDIVAVEMFFNNKDETWAVGIESRCERQLEWDYPGEQGKEAFEVYKTLKEYFVTRP